MTTRTRKRFTFFGKSMLWSLLLYTLMMLAFNWDELNGTANGRSKITVVSNVIPGVQPSISEQPANNGTVKEVAALLKTIGDIIIPAGR